MNYDNHIDHLELRIRQAEKAYLGHSNTDDGLEKIFDLVEIVYGRLRRGSSIESLHTALKQSHAGKGFHLATMYDTFYMTRDVIEMAFDSEGELPTGQKVTCWEHVIPWKQTLNRVISLVKSDENATPAKLIRLFVEGSIKCFVSGDEDRRLNDLGLNSEMVNDDVFGRYRLAKIQPLQMKDHDFNTINMKHELKRLYKLYNNGCKTKFLEDITV